MNTLYISETAARFLHNVLHNLDAAMSATTAYNQPTEQKGSKNKIYGTKSERFGFGSRKGF